MERNQRWKQIQEGERSKLTAKTKDQGSKTSESKAMKSRWWFEEKERSDSRGAKVNS